MCRLTNDTYKEINKLEPRESFKKITKNSHFQDQHYEHKPHFDYQVESVDKEHETQIARSPGKVSSDCGK